MFSSMAWILPTSKGYELGQGGRILVGPKGQAPSLAVWLSGQLLQLGYLGHDFIWAENVDGEAFLKLQEKMTGVYPGP